MAPSAVNQQLSQPCIHGDSASRNGVRKSRFMKWLAKLFESGSSRGEVEGSTHRPHLLGEENKIWRARATSLDDRYRAQKEKEELDRAIELSLAEEFGRLNANGYRRRLIDNEEWPARPLEDGLYSPPYHAYPPVPYNYGLYSPPYHAYPLAPYNEGEFRICGGCKRNIGYGTYFSCMGTFFHPDCFCCHACGCPITEHEFSLSGRNPYHKSCFKELNHPKCDVCQQFIPTNAAGLIGYRQHPYWPIKYCPSHEHDNTARCCSCERLESWNARHYYLEDGRRLCSECMESAIMDTGDCQLLYHAIRDYFERINMKIDQQIPMLLVGRQALNEASVGEKNGVHHTGETRGLCLSEEQTVTGIYRRPIFGRNRLGGMRTQQHQLTRKCEVTAILVLYGLPRLLTGSILTHELMHAWLRLRGFRNLNPKVEEGICQVLSYMWLESEVTTRFRGMPWHASESTSAEYKLGEFFMHQIATDSSPEYGGGFRAANAAVKKYGLRAALDHIHYTGYFPC